VQLAAKSAARSDLCGVTHRAAADYAWRVIVHIETALRLRELPSACRAGKKLSQSRRAMVIKHHTAIMRLTIVSCITLAGAAVQSAQPEHPINSVREIRASLRACWISPEMRTAPELTVRLSLKRNGEILGQPLISYQSPGASEDERAALHAAVAAALARCAPLPLSETLGGILAGHPINVKLGEGWKRRGAPTASPGR
jgi:hypothetical protein